MVTASALKILQMLPMLVVLLHRVEYIAYTVNDLFRCRPVPPGNGMSSGSLDGFVEDTFAQRQVVWTLSGINWYGGLLGGPQCLGMCRLCRNQVLLGEVIPRPVGVVIE